MKKQLTLLLLLPFFVPATTRCNIFESENVKWFAAATVGVGTIGYLAYKWWTKTPAHHQSKIATPAMTVVVTGDQDAKAVLTAPVSEAVVVDETILVPTIELVAVQEQHQDDVVDAWTNPTAGLNKAQKMQIRSFLKTVPSFNDFFKPLDDKVRRQMLNKVRQQLVTINVENMRFSYEKFPISQCLTELRDTLLVVSGQGIYKQLVAQLGKNAEERAIAADKIVLSHMKHAQAIVDYLLKTLA